MDIDVVVDGFGGTDRGGVLKDLTISPTTSDLACFSSCTLSASSLHLLRVVLNTLTSELIVQHLSFST